MDANQERMWRKRIRCELGKHFSWSNSAIENLFIRMLKLNEEHTKEELEDRKEGQLITDGTDDYVEL